jgi:hypothetical protein
MEKVYNKKHGKPKHSGFGIASFVIFITTVIAHFSVVWIKIALEMISFTAKNTNIALTPLCAFLFLCNFLFSILAEPIFAVYLLGLVLGTIGLFQKNRRKVFAVLGVVFNLLAFIVLMTIIVFISVKIVDFKP